MTPPAVRVVRLADRSLDEIADEAPRVCDACREEQLYGCLVGLHVGYDYRELCADCVDALRRGVERLPAPARGRTS